MSAEARPDGALDHGSDGGVGVYGHAVEHELVREFFARAA
ncbi:hypothetical protein HDC37_002356 [Microbacterium sp. AK009]|nr:hypothetical protein [Microbacterium sp. AK009]